MKPVLLTGATGFIGQHLQKTLLADKAEVLAIVRPSSSHKNALQTGVRSLQADLDNKEKLAPALSCASAVIYCAGSVRGRCLEDFAPANIDGVRAMVDAMNDAGSQAPLLLISSLAATRPHLSDYANSKYLGEQELIEHAKFPWTIFRPPAVYGPGDKEMLPILKLARKGIITPSGPVDQKLSLIHVSDVASAALAWLKSWQNCDKMIFTLDDGHSGGYDWHQIAQTASPGGYRRINIPRWILSTAGVISLALSYLFRFSPIFTPGKVRELTQADWVCNNTELSNATGWKPETGLEKGIEDLFGPTIEKQK